MHTTPTLKCRIISGIQVSLLGLLVFAAGADGAVVETLYFDIDFSSPLHLVGSRPTYSAGPATPTNNVFGSPEVVSGFGALTDQPVVLNTAGNPGSYYYDQFSLAMGYSQSTYHISLDLYTEGLIGSLNSFGIILDFKSVAKLGFYQNGKLYPPCWPSPAVTPRFADGDLMHVDISLDIPNNRSVTLVDGVLIGDGQIIGNSAPGDLKSVRFSLGSASLGTSDDRTKIAIDNILVTNGFLVPESTTSMLLMLSAVLGLAFRDRRPSTG